MLSTKKASTVQLYIIAAKLFFKFLFQHNIYPNITDNMKSAKVDHEHKKDALTINQCQALLQSIDVSTSKGLRDRAIISLMMTAGLRTIEVVRADVGDLYSFADSVYLFIQGKGHDEKSAKVLVASQVYNFIQAYLQTRKNLSNSEPLFTSTSRRNFNQRLDTQSISKLF
ncbi:MAG: tyrosine-type recombinase/integrase [Selenomonadaceae bacterium]|nr:tyrosine-type recombinase/integrase [Selenomonadaceae bacterium]